MQLARFEGNPILAPVKDHRRERQAVFNCGAVLVDGTVHLIYRACGPERVSRWGYARSDDGLHIHERSPEPIYVPHGDLDRFGCEDPRISLVGGRLFVSYTAYGIAPGMEGETRRSIQIAITSMGVEDMVSRRWDWTEPFYPFPGVDNKGAVIFPEDFNRRYVMYHRIPPHIWVAYSRDLRHWSQCSIVLSPRWGWEYYKIGTGAPPVEDGLRMADTLPRG
ncbi:MAG TPA: hypothetical protein EYP62_06750 [Kiritimatiellae bacterium]|nr:hypothetical protein [Kiritimatiellia bacterium]